MSVKPSATLVANQDEEHEEKYNFDEPEDVLIEVVKDSTGSSDWEGFKIAEFTIINTPDNVSGAATYDHIYGNFLNYTIEGMIKCPGEGWFVVEGITGHYSRGDGWSTDDDMDFYHENVRPATEEEIKLA